MEAMNGGAAPTMQTMPRTAGNHEGWPRHPVQALPPMNTQDFIVYGSSPQSLIAALKTHEVGLCACM